MKESKTQQVREAVLKLYRQLACAIIKRGDLLETEFTINTDEVIECNVRAHKEDHGKLVGGAGKTFTAFQTVLGLIGYQAGVVIRVNRLREPVHGEREKFMAPYEQNANWPKEEITALLHKTLKSFLHYPYTVELVEIEEGETRYVLKIDERENLPVGIVEISRVLSIIFHAIGKNKGRKIFVDDRESFDRNKTAVSRVA